MKLWKRTALALGAAALFFTARPAQAQMWVGPPGPVMVTPGWGVAPAWGVRTYYRPVDRPFRRAGWYGAVRGPRGQVVAVGRRW